jgi:hypothetical protein
MLTREPRVPADVRDQEGTTLRRPWRGDPGAVGLDVDR